MIDALPRRNRLRIVALTVFALIASLLGVTSASSASADPVYGGVRVVDLEGDPVANVDVFAQGILDDPDASPFADIHVELAGPDGVARFPATNLPSAPATVTIGYSGAGDGYKNYRWYGEPLLVEWMERDEARALFSPASDLLLELTMPIDQEDGAISGTRSLVPALAEAWSTVTLAAEDGTFLRTARTDSSGRYAFTGLPEGTYKLRFDSNVTGTGVSYGYTGSWYKDKANFEDAIPVEVGTSPVTNVNQTLTAAAEVRGMLGAGAADLAAPVVAFLPASWTSETPDWNSEDIHWARPYEGVYDTVLTPGSYRVAFLDRVTSGGFEWDPTYDYTLIEYWSGSATLAGAKVLTVGSGEKRTVNGLDAPSFTDVAPGNQFEYEITWLASSGVTTGYDDGTFKPLATVNRDAMAAFLYRFAGKPTYNPPAVSPFVDVPTSNQFYKEITWLASTGITTGWDIGGGKKEFRPLQPVARDAMAAFLYRFAKSPSWDAPGTSPFIDVATSSQFYAEITWLAGQGISTGWDVAGGKKEYRPLGTVNRDAMAAFLYRFPTWLRGGWSDPI